VVIERAGCGECGEVFDCTDDCPEQSTPKCGFGGPGRTCDRIAVEAVAVGVIPDVWHQDDVRHAVLALCDKHRLGRG
jgi:hypothetical protein